MLIEVLLPLEAIHREAAREESIRHGHPSTQRLWRAHQPPAAGRAVLCAQLVDDPSSHPDRCPTEGAQKQVRMHGDPGAENVDLVVQVRAEHVEGLTERLAGTVGGNSCVLGFDLSEFEDVEW
jgi:putative DNA methylase